MDDNSSKRIATLEAELAALRAEIETLSAMVGAARERIDLSMRGQQRCPACACRSILHANEVLDRGDGDSREKMALVKPSVWRSRTDGHFQVYVCTKCGLVEWYMDDVNDIPVDDKVVRIIEGQEPSAGGPYR